jgi:LCP family protein required for cell wall assembly
MYRTAQTAADRMYKPLEQVKTQYVSKDPDVRSKSMSQIIDRGEPFTVLVMGSDERHDETGRTDTLVLIAVNPAKQSALMFSIPRDSLTAIIGHGTNDKISHAYAFGGVEESIDTVENFVDYPIDYYIHVNMQGFTKVIDLLGGVEVDNKTEFSYRDFHFAKGTLSLNGQEALAFSRMRKEDPKGDFGRNDRQREILHQLMNKALRVSNVVQLDKIMKELGAYVTTNLTFQEMKTILYDHRASLKQIDSTEIRGTGKKIKGIWYYVVEREERDRLHDMIKKNQYVEQKAIPNTRQLSEDNPASEPLAMQAK